MNVFYKGGTIISTFKEGTFYQSKAEGTFYQSKADCLAPCIQLLKPFYREARNLSSPCLWRVL